MNIDVPTSSPVPDAYLASSDDSPTTSSAQLYCPSCGHLIADAFDCPGRGQAGPYIQITCWQPECLLRGATTSDKSLADDDWLVAWHVARRFNLYTGERLE